MQRTFGMPAETAEHETLRDFLEAVSSIHNIHRILVVRWVYVARYVKLNMCFKYCLQESIIMGSNHLYCSRPGNLQSQAPPRTVQLDSSFSGIRHGQSCKRCQTIGVFFLGSEECVAFPDAGIQR